MATRLVVLRSRPRRRRSGIVAAVVVLAAALALHLWLVALGVVVAAFSFGRSHLRHTRRLLPALLAGRALIDERPSAVEDWTATWLAVLAGGRAPFLCRAARLVAALEEDPWRAQVAIVRLEAADEALTSGRVLGLVRSRAGPGPTWRAAAWGGLAVILLALSGGGSLWWLLPVGVALLGLNRAFHDIEESRALPKLLAREAASLEVIPDPGGQEGTPILDLILLSGGDRHCLHRARHLIEGGPCSLPGRDVAVRHLQAAEAMVEEAAGRLVLVSDGGLHWWIGRLVLLLAPRSWS